jgi:LuxR family transcriptional regulator, maltose regulon positive regulatory protein
MRGSARTTGTPSVVARTGLFDRLSAGLEDGLILLSAPAGSGKTLLLRSWIDAAGLGAWTAWTSIEREERDGQRFWLSVVRALRGAGIKDSLDGIEPAPQFDGRAVALRVVDATESLDAPVLLVIDDLHELLEPAAMTELGLLLARRPPQLRVVLSTRHDPPLELHRYLIAGELTELRAEDLRFQRDEASELLKKAGVKVSDAALGALLARTEGWAAGLRLAALSLAGDRDPDRFVAEFSGSERTVADYLVAEVLLREPESVRRLLLRTSILERVNGSLADRLVGTSGSERRLLELEDAGAFVVSMDRERSWFRYHHLFADLLRLELRRSEPGSVVGLHRTAAEWFAEHGYRIEAIRHAQSAQDWRLAGDLIGQHGFSLALDGSFATMRALLERFPPEAFDNPELAAFLAYGEVIRPSLDSAEAYIAVAETHASEVPEKRRHAFEAMLATARLTLARWRGDYATAMREVRPLLVPAQPETVEQITVGNDARAVALMSLGIVELWAGAAADAERHLIDATELARLIKRPYIEQGALAHLALAVGRSSVTRGRELALHALEILERHGWLSEPITPVVLAAVGGFDSLQGRFDEAQPWLDRAEQSLQPNAEPAKELLIRYARGIQRLGQRRLGEATALFAETQRLQSLLVDPDPLAISARGLLTQALVQLGDLPGAQAALATASDAEQEYAETRVALAAVYLAQRNPRLATDVLAPVMTAALPAVFAEVSAINGLVVDALAREALGEAAAAEHDIERALDVAEPEALILPFLITPARPLLDRHPRHRTAHAALLATILDVLAGSAPPARRDESDALQEDLTESELRVLRYLPSNLTAPEIAAEVFLSTSTVKTHMRHIYEKLGAHKRAEAVQRARELGLLGPSTRARR